MENSLGAGFSYAFSILAGVFLTVLFISLGYDHHIQLNCDRAVEKLVDESRANGYISYPFTSFEGTAISDSYLIVTLYMYPVLASSLLKSR